MPSSSATAAFTFKNFKKALPPVDADVGITTILKKKRDDLTFSLQFSDASLKDPKGGQGILISAEKPLGGITMIGMSLNAWFFLDTHLHNKEKYIDGIIFFF